MSGAHEAVCSRREFISASAVGVLGIVGTGVGPHRAAEALAYVGTYTTDGRSQGIYFLRLDTDSGVLRLDGVAAVAANPSYLAIHPNGRALFAANELSTFGGQPSGAVSAFAIDGRTGRLRLLNRQSSGGTAPCYVSVDRSGRFVLVANYGGGSVTSLPVGRDGRLAAARRIVRHEGRGADAVRQTAPHAHCILPDPDNRYVLVVDLGTDAVIAYRFDDRAGTLSVVTPGTAMRPGAGPRHLTFHPNGRFAYVVNELDSTLSVFRYDGVAGALEEIEVVEASPGGTVPDNHPADVHVASTGRVLYASNRGDDTIAVFAIDGATGRLTPVQQIPSGGRSPRNFALDPTGRFVVAANQRSDTIMSFRVDPESGRLTPTGSAVEVPSPVCIRFR